MRLDAKAYNEAMKSVQAGNSYSKIAEQLSKAGYKSNNGAAYLDHNMIGIFMRSQGFRQKRKHKKNRSSVDQPKAKIKNPHTGTSFEDFMLEILSTKLPSEMKVKMIKAIISDEA